MNLEAKYIILLYEYVNTILGLTSLRTERNMLKERNNLVSINRIITVYCVYKVLHDWVNSINGLFLIHFVQGELETTTLFPI